MDIPQFWLHIEAAKQASNDDLDKMCDELKYRLAKLEDQEIISFQNIFNQLHADSYQSRLWAAAYIINGGCSDDGFDYFRGWLIAQGQDIYEKALADPESLADVLAEGEEGEFEEMLYIAGLAWEQKHGGTFYESEGWEQIKHIPFPPIEFDWTEDDESLQATCPRLFAKFILD